MYSPCDINISNNCQFKFDSLANVTDNLNKLLGIPGVTDDYTEETRQKVVGATFEFFKNFKGQQKLFQQNKWEDFKANMKSLQLDVVSKFQDKLKGQQRRKFYKKRKREGDLDLIISKDIDGLTTYNPNYTNLAKLIQVVKKVDMLQVLKRRKLCKNELIFENVVGNQFTLTKKDIVQFSLKEPSDKLKKVLLDNLTKSQPGNTLHFEEITTTKGLKTLINYIKNVSEQNYPDNSWWTNHLTDNFSEKRSIKEIMTTFINQIDSDIVTYKELYLFAKKYDLVEIRSFAKNRLKEIARYFIKNMAETQDINLLLEKYENLYLSDTDPTYRKMLQKGIDICLRNKYESFNFFTMETVEKQYKYAQQFNYPMIANHGYSIFEKFMDNKQDYNSFLEIAAQFEKILSKEDFSLLQSIFPKPFELISLFNESEMTDFPFNFNGCNVIVNHNHFEKAIELFEKFKKTTRYAPIREIALEYSEQLEEQLKKLLLSEKLLEKIEIITLKSDNVEIANKIYTSLVNDKDVKNKLEEKNCFITSQEEPTKFTLHLYKIPTMSEFLGLEANTMIAPKSEESS